MYKRQVHIVTSEKEYEYRGKLKDVADITEEYFLLIHKSYLINMEHVEHYAVSYTHLLYKRIRKYNGFVTGLTQNVEELLKSDTARLMLDVYKRQTRMRALSVTAMNFYIWVEMKKKDISMSRNYWEKRHWIPIPTDRQKGVAAAIR